jgi:hypothetical protein
MWAPPRRHVPAAWTCAAPRPAASQTAARAAAAQADPNARCGGGDTALHAAVRFGDGNAAAVKALLRAGAPGRANARAALSEGMIAADGGVCVWVWVS